MTKTQIQTRWNSTGFRRRLSLCLLLLWPWPLTFWPNQYVPGPGTYVTYIGGEISWNSYEYIVHPVFGVIDCCDLDLWPLIPRANQHIYESKYISEQNWVKFRSLVFEIWCSQGFFDTQTHTLTDGQTWIQNALAPFSNGGEGTKM